MISPSLPSPPTSSKKRSFHRDYDSREEGSITITTATTATLFGRSSNGRSGGTSIFFSKAGAENDDDDEGGIGDGVGTSSSGGDDRLKEEGFDAAGFAGYLAPYVLTLLLSIAVTGAFFKFVMMDY